VKEEREEREEGGERWREERGEGERRGRKERERGSVSAFDNIHRFFHLDDLHARPLPPPANRFAACVRSCDCVCV
jgi:hypothetical protein